jgi:hypothetical protein
MRHPALHAKPVADDFARELERGNCACCDRYDGCEQADSVQGHCDRFRETDDLELFRMILDCQHQSEDEACRDSIS